MINDVLRISESWTHHVDARPAPVTTAIAFVCEHCGARLSDAQQLCHGTAPMRALEHSIVERDGKVTAAARAP